MIHLDVHIAFRTADALSHNHVTGEVPGLLRALEFVVSKVLQLDVVLLVVSLETQRQLVLPAVVLKGLLRDRLAQRSEQRRHHPCAKLLAVGALQGDVGTGKVDLLKRGHRIHLRGHKGQPLTGSGPVRLTDDGLGEIGVFEVGLYRHFKRQVAHAELPLLRQDFGGDGRVGVGLRVAFVDDDQLAKLAAYRVVFNLTLLKSHVAFDLKLVGHDLPKQHQDQPGVRQEDANLLLAESEPLEVRSQKVDQQYDRHEVAPNEREFKHCRVTRRENEFAKPLLLRIHHRSVTGQLVKPCLIRLPVAQLVNDPYRLGWLAVLCAGQLHVRAGISVDRNRLGSRELLDPSQPKLPAPTVNIFP